MISFISTIIPAFIFVILSIIIAYKIELGLEKKILIVCISALIQLLILGFIINIIFNLGLLFTFLMIFVMIVIASYMIKNDINIDDKGVVFFSSCFSLFFTSLTSLIILIYSGVIELKPQYIIPLIGMVIGNSMNSITLCLERLLNDLKSNKDVLLGYLALGASDYQAMKPFIKDAIKAALIPQMNRTKTVGIIFIPGAMVGMLLSGANPLHAAEIQIVIMWMVLSGALISTLIACHSVYKKFMKYA
jgi:putative ABC transport system permease protein